MNNNVQETGLMEIPANWRIPINSTNSTNTKPITKNPAVLCGTSTTVTTETTKMLVTTVVTSSPIVCAYKAQIR